MATRRKTKIAVRAEAVTPFDAADYLKSEKAMAAYLKACFEDGEPGLIAGLQLALHDVPGSCAIQLRHALVDRFHDHVRARRNDQLIQHGEGSFALG
jgi:DNA-binding phage protein